MSIGQFDETITSPLCQNFLPKWLIVINQISQYRSGRKKHKFSQQSLSDVFFVSISINFQASHISRYITARSDIGGKLSKRSIPLSLSSWPWKGEIRQWDKEKEKLLILWSWKGWSFRSVTCRIQSHCTWLKTANIMPSISEVIETEKEHAAAKVFLSFHTLRSYITQTNSFNQGVNSLRNMEKFAVWSGSKQGNWKGEIGYVKLTKQYDEVSDSRWEAAHLIGVQLLRPHPETSEN